VTLPLVEPTRHFTRPNVFIMFIFVIHAIRVIA
jgi:hypothetical protein